MNIEGYMYVGMFYSILNCFGFECMIFRKKLQRMRINLINFIFNVSFYMYIYMLLSDDYCCSGKRCVSWAFAV